jgi:lipopolysaccharide/colanic/teichoic acid biosynthesis glycosyltransferase
MGGTAMTTGRAHIIDEGLFRSIVVRERRRAERSQQTFVLLIVDAPRSPAHGSSPWASAIEAVIAATRESDVIGWFESRRSIGVAVCDVRPADLAAACAALGARVHAELAARVGAADAPAFGVRFQVHPQAAGAPAPAEPAPVELAASRYDALKRALDVIGSLALLILLSPLLLLIAAPVKLKSRGPVFYRQVRIGRDMQPFTLLKFRTMYTDCDSKMHHEFVSSFIKAGGQANGAAVFKITNDPRVTPIGRVLRKTSLDELPQLWNVLRGDMSLVGPRPPLPYELEQYQPWHRRRVLEAKPGITGLWQVAGRSRTTFDEMVRLDLRYARNRSLWTDVKILLATPAAVISGKGAC